MVEDINNSILASIGQTFAWIFAPLGWGFWEGAVASVTGLIAKENVVQTFGQIFGFAEVAEDGVEVWGTLAMQFTTLSAYSFLVFNLLCAPCFAAIGAIKREMNSAKWTIIAISYQCIFAYVVALMVYQIGNLMINGIFGFWTIIAFIILAGMIYLLIRKPKQNQTLEVEFSMK